MPRIFAALLLSLLCCIAGAQVDPSAMTAPPESTIRQWLTGNDARLAAWGAFFILRDERTVLRPDLEAAVERVEAQRKKAEGKPDGDWGRALLAMLDAVIQLKGELPPEAVAALPERARAQKLILLDRMDWSQTEKVWLAMYRPDADGAREEARVAAEELARHGTRGFAVKLMQTIVIHALVEVHNPHERSLMGIGAGHGCCMGSGVGRLLSLPWPQFGGYTLLVPNGLDWIPPSGAWMLIGKPDPIYVQRTVSTTHLATNCGATPGFSDSIRSHLVGTLLGGETAPFQWQTVSVAIPFTSREDYQTRVEAFVADQQENFHLVGSRLTAQGLMTEEERQSLALRMILTLSDLRKRGAVELPAIVFREPVRWGEWFEN